MINNQSFYRQKSNITTTISIKGNHEQDYLELRDLLVLGNPVRDCP